MGKPWMKFYPADWRADPRLRMCSLAARGLWIDMISYMHEAEPYGHLLINGIAPSTEDIAALVGRPLGEVRKALAELEARQVFSRQDDGAMFSRRMVRDKAKADQDRENGKGGGNPELIGEDKGGVNPPDKAQKPEARYQNLESESGAGARPIKIPRKVNSAMPDDFVLDARMLRFAAERGFSGDPVQAMFGKFCDHHRARGNRMADWHAAWQTWVRNQVEFQQQRQPPPGQRRTPDV